ncbi:PREDICTED: putative F-box/LRR-repeat protein At3g58920 [Camelina sativa]|uniref:F-box/LRR-repeat protein At3g58920 n=1 Tax=Camelina sativa TaxID=90675 RepID=A0ABM1RBK7_CAMSA|nr:PREDICTED: putative F-box/LRR-repeat protein At3g58920 [Camelina sativa]
MEELLTACLVLEELTICDGSWQNGEWCRTMSSLTLKKLTIKSIRFNNSVMSFDTPSLAYLEYTDVVPREYPIVNLESLVEARLDLYCPRFHISNPTNLIKGLRNVEVLEISSIRTSEMLYHFREAIPVFSNLIRLTITTHFYSYHWKYFPILVKKSPNLHTLIIKGPLPVFKSEGEYGSCPVKVLKITEYVGTIAELEKMKHFLEKLSSLELVKVCACAIKDKEKDRITKDLLRVPRSSKCNIKIKFCEKTK